MNNSIEIYRSQDGSVQLNVKLENETVWLNRQQMAELFGRDYKTISKHINNALHEELEGEPVVAKFATTKNYGRVEGLTQDQYLIKGYVINQQIKLDRYNELKDVVRFRRQYLHF